MSEVEVVFMNITVIGCGKIGHKIVEKLSQENELNITVIDLKQSVITEVVNKYDVMGVVGDCIDIVTLEEADIENTDIVIATTGSDEINFTTCLLAKKLGDCQAIARVRKRQYRKSIHLFKKDIGLELIINSDIAAAQEIARALKFPNAIQIDTYAKGQITACTEISG